MVVVMTETSKEFAFALLSKMFLVLDKKQNLAKIYNSFIIWHVIDNDFD